ncbi:MAG: hypothetical protein U0132_02295 [Gemmatimonadaceae bacterium]
MSAWELPEPALDEDTFDGDLPPFGVLLEALGDIDAAVDEDQADVAIGTDPAGANTQFPLSTTLGRAMEIEGITLSVAIELAVRPDAQDRVQVRGSTPTQYTETTVLPAFHKLTMHIAREPHGEE